MGVERSIVVLNLVHHFCYETAIACNSNQWPIEILNGLSIELQLTNKWR